MQMCISGTKTRKHHWVNKNDLMDRVRKSVADFTSVFANIEMDYIPVTGDPVEQGDAMTAIIGFEGGCSGFIWACCSESFAGLMANRLRRMDIERIEEGKRAAMNDMITLLGGDIRLMFSKIVRDVSLSEISVFKADEFDCSAITGHPENLRCLFRHFEEDLHVGVILGKDFKAFQ